MSLIATIKADLVTAMKAGDDTRKLTLRAIIASVQTAETAEGVDGPLDDAAVEKLIATEVKQRTEAADIYTEAGDETRAGVEVAERTILQEYLPEPLGDEELEAIVTEAIAAGGYSSKKDMGSAIKDVMAKVSGRADGKRVSQLVGNLLS